LIGISRVNTASGISVGLADTGPDQASTDLGPDYPPPPSKTTGCEDLFKKPMDPVENITIHRVK